MTPLPGKAARGTGPEGEEARRTLVLLGALCLFLSTLEYLVPKPLPFIRIGLANLPLLLALDLLRPRDFVLLTLIKIAGGGIVGGNLFSYGFLFSLGGSAASALVMYGLALFRRWGGAPGLAGIGTAGALCSTGIQLFLARFLIFGEGARYLIPPFLAAALVTGFSLGLFCEHFRRHSRWYARRTGAEARAPLGRPAGAPSPEPRRPEPGREKRRNRWDSLFDSRDLAIAGFFAVLLFLFNPSTLGRGGQFLFFWFCAWASGKKNRPLITLSVIAGVVLVNLLAPYGRVLAEAGPFSVTAGSLAMGLRKGLTLEGLVMLSAALIRARAAPSPGPRDGSFRLLLAESLAVFAALNERRRLIRPGHLSGDLDGLLLDMEDPAPGGRGGLGLPRGAGEGQARRARGRPLLILGLLFTAAFTAAPAILTGMR